MTRHLPATLYHYSCAHQASLIEGLGYVQPMPQLLLRGTPLAWFTDLTPDLVAMRPGAVGLTNHLVGCDRTEAAWTVHRTGVLPWSEWRNTWVRGLLTTVSPLDWRKARHAVLSLESAPDAMPAHWYVASDRVQVRTRVEG